MALEEKALSPYPQGTLPEDHQTQIEKIRQQLVAWRDAASSASARRKPAGTVISGDTHDALTVETERLAGMSSSAL